MIWFFLVALNLTAFIVMGIDKYLAVVGAYRISEKTLLTVCAPFAALGGLIGMHVFHHKTRKPKFNLGVPMMLVVQLIILGTLMILIP